RKMMLWSALPVLIALLAASLLLGVTVGNAYARSAYDDERYAVAAERYRYQQAFTPEVVEPWKAWFNSGTAELRAASHFRASEDLRQALRLVPPGTTDAEGAPDPSLPECRVRTNLSLALESLGDDSMDEGAPEMASNHYNEALDMIGPCTSDGE